MRLRERERERIPPDHFTRETDYGLVLLSFDDDDVVVLCCCLISDFVVLCRFSF